MNEIRIATLSLYIRRSVIARYARWLCQQRVLWICAALSLPVMAPACRDAPGERAEPVSGPGRVIVRMHDEMRFAPEPVIAHVGDTVVWYNAGALPHTTTNAPGTAANPLHAVLPAGADAWDSGLLESAQTFSVILGTPGTYAYLCTLHEAVGMVGNIVVRSTPG